jgi:hypothetical protein
LINPVLNSLFVFPGLISRFQEGESQMSVTAHSHAKGKKAASSSRRRTGSAMQTDDARTVAIAVRAYYMAEQRGFEPGHELEDWLNAEQQESRH